MIVDTSAIIAMIFAEEEADRVVAALTRLPVDNRISAANYLEAGIVTDGRGDPVKSAQLDAFVDELDIAVIPVTRAHAEIARIAYRTYGKGSGHPARLNFGDCFAYALAIDRGEPLLFKGGDFAKTDVKAARY